MSESYQQRYDSTEPDSHGDTPEPQSSEEYRPLRNGERGLQRVEEPRPSRSQPDAEVRGELWKVFGSGHLVSPPKFPRE